MKRAGWVCTGLGLALGLLPVAAAPDLDRLVDGHTAFALELYSRLDREGNLFLSPYSLSSALAMTYAGARGQTAAEMEEALVFRLGQEGTHSAFSALQARLRQVQEAGAVRLSVANSLWPQKGEPFRPDYLALLNEYYGTGITPLDFMGNPEEARQAINRWVEEQTQDKIRELIGRGVLGPLTRMVLVNAIYFKGSWAHAFIPDHTRDADFFTGPGRKVTVALMTQTRPFPYGEFEDYRVVQLPYAGNDLSMLVVLPKRKGGLGAIEAGLSPERLAGWRAGLSRREVRVFLPKFKLTWGTADLTRPLQAMGMGKAFSATDADFSGMDGRAHELFVGAVLHKAFVEVNEEGTEAAAATAVGFRTLGARKPPSEFRADHPFLFWIQENRTGAILFLGRVADPAKTE